MSVFEDPLWKCHAAWSPSAAVARVDEGMAEIGRITPLDRFVLYMFQSSHANPFSPCPAMIRLRRLQCARWKMRWPKLKQDQCTEHGGNGWR